VFAHHEVRVGVGAAVTDREGGVSRPPYDELNLADHVGDAPDAVANNRRRVLAAVGPAGRRLATMRQVHGCDVAVVDGSEGASPTADALVTTTAGVVLTVLVADCTPVLLWDRRARVVAAAHVGRRGLAAGVVGATIEAMTALHGRPDRMYAVVGPAICADHYEVPTEMQAEVAALVPAAKAATGDGRPALDIRAGVLAQLRESGVSLGMFMPQCTAETASYFSYRRDGTTGRFAGLVWLEP
jgi:YfiH family protein